MFEEKIHTTGRYVSVSCFKAELNISQKVPVSEMYRFRKSLPETMIYQLTKVKIVEVNYI